MVSFSFYHILYIREEYTIITLFSPFVSQVNITKCKVFGNGKVITVYICAVMNNVCQLLINNI